MRERKILDIIKILKEEVLEYDNEEAEIDEDGNIIESTYLEFLLAWICVIGIDMNIINKIKLASSEKLVEK